MDSIARLAKVVAGLYRICAEQGMHRDLCILYTAAIGKAVFVHKSALRKVARLGTAMPNSVVLRIEHCKKHTCDGKSEAMGNRYQRREAALGGKEGCRQQFD